MAPGTKGEPIGLFDRDALEMSSIAMRSTVSRSPPWKLKEDVFVADAIVKEMIEAGVHFGHRTSLWNPKMAPYIFGRKNQIHILDIRETLRGLLRAKKYLSQVAAGGSLILFVGTKRQAGEAVEAQVAALRHAVCQRTMARRHLDQFSHDSQPAWDAWKNSKSFAAATESTITARRCSRR